eukprot:41268-Amphidinium_carterae.1
MQFITDTPNQLRTQLDALQTKVTQQTATLQQHEHALVTQVHTNTQITDTMQLLDAATRELQTIYVTDQNHTVYTHNNEPSHFVNCSINNVDSGLSDGQQQQHSHHEHDQLHQHQHAHDAESAPRPLLQIATTEQSHAAATPHTAPPCDWDVHLPDGYHLHDVTGDGRCLYRSLAYIRNTSWQEEYRA